MERFEADPGQANIWLIFAAFIGFISLLAMLRTWMAVFGLLLALFFFYFGRRLQAMRYYVMSDESISVEGTDKTIPFSEIVDFEPTNFRMMKIGIHNGENYYYNKSMATMMLSLIGQVEEVLVYTRMKKNLLIIYGMPYDCFVLTPKDRDGFLLALKENMEKYRAAHPAPAQS